MINEKEETPCPKGYNWPMDGCVLKPKSEAECEHCSMEPKTNMSTYLVFALDNGSPNQESARLIRNEKLALTHALFLCKKNGIPFDTVMHSLRNEDEPEIEWDVGHFELGIGYGEKTVSGYVSKTVYIWEMDVI